MTKGKIAVVSVASPEEPKGYEGSYEDWKQDYSGANRKGQTVEQYEDSAEDRIADKAGSKRMREKETSKQADQHGAPPYRPGQPHFSQTPKTSSGFGHKGNQRQGALRCSGHSRAHQIGKKK